jgi:hypothetical protein
LLSSLQAETANEKCAPAGHGIRRPRTRFAFSGLLPDRRRGGGAPEGLRCWTWLLRREPAVPLASDLLQVDDADIRKEPIEMRKRRS